MLDDSDIPFHNLFSYIIGSQIVFHFIEFRVRSNFVNRLIKQISFRRCDFSDCPIGIADIFFRCKLPIRIGHIFIYQCFAFVDTINCTCKCRIALCCAFFLVTLSYSHCEFLQNVTEITLCHRLPLNSCCLILRYNIAYLCIYFFYGIRFTSADQHIFESCYSVCVCHCILIDCNACKGSTIKTEFHTLNKIIF